MNFGLEKLAGGTAKKVAELLREFSQNFLVNIKFHERIICKHKQ